MNFEEFLLPARIVHLPFSAEYVSNGYVSFAEASVGIIPGSFANLMALLLPNQQRDILQEFSSSKITLGGTFVCGLVPGSTAYASGKIFLGDHIVAVNGSASPLTSFEDGLRLADRSGSHSVQVTTRSLRIDQLANAFGKTVVSDYVIHFGENTHWNSLCNSLSLFPFAVFCCGQINNQETSEVSYTHPLSDSRLQKALEGVVPCLMSLADDYTKRSTIDNMQVRLEKENISVAVNKTDSSGGIVLALPTRVADVNACCKALQIMLRVISFYFGSYERAFPASNMGSTEETDRIISVILFELLCPDLLFEELQMSTDMSWSLFQTKFAELPHLPLPETVKVSVDSLLTDFEASDFSDPFLIPPRRRFVVMGSCLFYKGFLIASHLNTSDLIDIGLFLRHRFILSALAFSPQMAPTLCGSLLGGPSAPELASSPRGEQSVIWCEVFPTHRKKTMGQDDEPVWPSFGYSEPPNSRYILLVVPKKQTFLAVLLEASGLAAANTQEQLMPDSVIVREVSKLLNRLDGIGLLSFCEQGLASSLGVKLVSADSAFPSASLFLQTGSHRSRSGGIVLQTLAVTNAKRFGSALKSFLRTQKSMTMSFSSEQPQYYDSETEGFDINQDDLSPGRRKSVVAKFTGWLKKRRFIRRGLSRSTSFSDFAGDDNFGNDGPPEFDAAHYIESRETAHRDRGGTATGGMAQGTGNRERAGVPGSFAGSGGTMSTSEGPGRDEGIPLPLANALPTLFDMSEAHLHSGDHSSNTYQSGNRGAISSAVSGGAHQDILFSCPGFAFSYIFFDRNQGFYVCPGDTYTPPGSSLFHRRVSDTFLRSTINIVNMFDEEAELEEAVFLYPTDPIEWFDCDPAVIDKAYLKRLEKNAGKPCSSAGCSPGQAGQNGNTEESEQSLPFDLNPVAAQSQSYWCTLRKFPTFQEKEDGANLQSSARMFALCGDESAVNSALDLGLQFAFDLTL